MTEIQRIRKAINWLLYKGVAENDRELSEIMGYTKSSFSQIVNGRVPLSDKFAKKLCRLDENINEVWILTGEGEMFKNEPETNLNSEKRRDNSERRVGCSSTTGTEPCIKG